MEEEIIFDEVNIIEQKLDIIEKNELQKDQNSSQETSQYEKSPKKEKQSSDSQIVILKEKEKIQENEEKKEEIKSTYILKYSRKKEELKELSSDTRLKKAENCSYMLDIKLIPKNKTSQNENKTKGETPMAPDYLLVIYCHEIAAFSFDEIYERIYSLEDLCKENRYFRIFESNDETKIFIDEFITINQNNPNKFFFEFKDKTFKIHMKFSFFDKEKEIIFNIPKKNLTIKEKNEILPQLLKEIQDKMNNLAIENKKLKNKSLSQSYKIKKLKNDLNNGESKDMLNKTEINENKINDNNKNNILKKKKSK